MKIDKDELAKLLTEGGAIGSIVRLVRPLAVTMIVAIPAIGAFSVGVVTFFDAATGKAMAVNAGLFFNGIPGELYTLIGVIATGYIGFKSWETKAASPVQAAQEDQVDQDDVFDEDLPLVDQRRSETGRVVFDPRLVEEAIEATGPRPGVAILDEEEESGGLFVDEDKPLDRSNTTKEITL